MKTDRKHILCGTDFSVHAQEAANVAAALAVRWEETLVLIHVAEDGGLGPSHPQVLDELVGRRREQLHAEAERLRGRGATVKAELLTGSPYEGLVEAARPASTRLVVVSSLGRIAPSRFLIGSVAERTAERSLVPTLIVRDAAPLLAWARGERPLKVFVGYDFSGSSDAALRWAKTLQEMAPCEVTVAHVNWPPDDCGRLGVSGSTSFPEHPAEVQQVLERELGERVAGMFGEGPVRLLVEAAWGRTDAHLLQVAQREQADLMVVGTHQRRGLNRLWLGSVSRAVLHHAPGNVAIVPVSKTGQAETVRIPEWRRVLVPTDFSELANRAIPQAYAALRRGGSVCLVHVMDPSESPQPGPADHAGPRRLKESEARLKALIPAEAEARGIETRLEVVESREPAKAISQAAERFGADLICIGSHGRSGLSKAVLGSVAQAVMAHSPRPLLVVRPLVP